MKDSVSLLLFSIVVCMCIAGCANVKPPDGGPEDKTPPFIDTAEVMKPITRFHEKSVWLHFSEYVDKSRVAESVIISPERHLEYSWSGRELEIRFAEALDSNTTYALTLGTDYADLHGNKPKDAYTMIFSTGDHLDSGRIAGDVLDPNPAGVFVFLYSLNAINPDTLDPSHTKPRYRTQTGSSGSFEFHALPVGRYRLMAIRDVARDGLYTPGTDAFGTTVSDVEVTIGPIPRIQLRINAAEDLLGPQVVEIRARSSERVDVIMSENIDTLSVHAGAFTILDTLEKNSVRVRAAFVSTASPKNISLVTDAFPTASTWQLKLRTDSLGIRDTSANHVVDSLSLQRFSSVVEQDTSAPLLLSVSARDSSRSMPLKPSFRLVFSSAIQRDGVDQHIGLFKNNIRVAATTEWRGDNILVFHSTDSLEAESWYELRFRMTGVNGANGRALKDSTVRLRFQTLDTRNFGSIRGELSDSASPATSYVIILSSKTAPTRVLTLAKPGPFAFTLLPEGEYTLEAYCDSDANGRYSAGRAFPYKAAERFVKLASSLALKPRWSLDDVHIVFQKSP